MWKPEHICVSLVRHAEETFQQHPNHEAVYMPEFLGYTNDEKEKKNRETRISQQQCVHDRECAAISTVRDAHWDD